MHRLWLILGSVFTFAVLGFGSYSAVNALAHEEVEMRDVVTAAGVDEIVVDTSNGSIDVVGDPTATDITVDATISHGLRRTDYSVAVRGGRLIVDSRCNLFAALWCRVDVTVTTPVDIPLDIDTSNGTIDIADIDASVKASTSNGAIGMVGLAGPVDADTSNGSIRGHGLSGDSTFANTSNGTIELTFSRPPRSVNADTSNGSVRITVPDGPIAYDVDTDTGGHSSTQVTVRTDPTSDHHIVAETNNGSISVFYPTS